MFDVFTYVFLIFFIDLCVTLQIHILCINIVMHQKFHGNCTFDLRRDAGGRGAVTPAPQMEVPAMAVVGGVVSGPCPAESIAGFGATSPRHGSETSLRAFKSALPMMTRKSGTTCYSLSSETLRFPKRAGKVETAWLPVLRSSLRPAHWNPGAWNSKGDSKTLRLSRAAETWSGSGFKAFAV